MNPFDIPGLRCCGLLLLGDGSLLPEFVQEEPADRPSINTPEGWKELVERMGWREN